MKVAVIGLRSCFVSDLEGYLPKDMTELVSGGARGIDVNADFDTIEKALSSRKGLKKA